MAAGCSTPPSTAHPPHSGDSENTSKTWSSLFQKEIPPRMQFFEPEKNEKGKVVRLPKDVIEEGSKRWEKCLVGQFVGSAPPFGLLQALVRKVWSKSGEVVISTKGKLFIFQFSNPSMMSWVLESGPWKVGNKMLLLQQWSPELTISDVNLRKTPVWVVLRNIPLHLYNHRSLCYLASAVGRPLYMDRGTSRLFHLDFARICVEIDIEDELEDHIKVDIGDDQIVEIPVIIPWMPESCKKCKQFGHSCKDEAKGSQVDIDPKSGSEGSNVQDDSEKTTEDNKCSETEQVAAGKSVKLNEPNSPTVEKPSALTVVSPSSKMTLTEPGSSETEGLDDSEPDMEESTGIARLRESSSKVAKNKSSGGNKKAKQAPARRKRNTTKIAKKGKGISPDSLIT